MPESGDCQEEQWSGKFIVCSDLIACVHDCTCNFQHYFGACRTWVDLTKFIRQIMHQCAYNIMVIHSHLWSPRVHKHSYVFIA